MTPTAGADFIPGLRSSRARSTSRFRSGAIVAAVLAIAVAPAALTGANPAVSPDSPLATLSIEEGIPIYVGPDEPEPLLRAVEDLQRDFRNVTGRGFPLLRDKEKLNDGPAIVVVGPASNVTTGQDRWAHGWEAHRVFVEQAGGHHHIVLQGADLRGAIYAVYSFSERFLGIPPLWVWTSHQIETREKLEVPLSTDLHFPPPYVKWRTWFPNDQDYLEPWKRIGDNRELVAETLLRMKLNSWDTGSILSPSVTGIVADSRTARDRGIVVLSTHTTPLGARVEETRWNNYWTNIRGETPPAIALENTEALIDYWRHSLTTILSENLETVWTVTFRGHGDIPFWQTYPDAPESDAERAAVIQYMIGRQLELLHEHAGEEAVIRVPLYNEMSDFFLAGLLELPRGDNIIWNLVAARRDHYPPDGVFDMEFPGDQPLGLYFNIQFTSTGSHVAQGEGPWKMEANFRTIDELTPEPLALSMVNAGNIREFVMELAANARMMGDFSTYDSDAFVQEFAAEYFGEENAEEIAQLYRDFYLSYWEQRPPSIEGFERQYFFHDLRYARMMREILPHIENGHHTKEPVHLVSADFFQIDPAHTGAANTLDAVIAGTTRSIAKLEDVTSRADALLPKIDPSRRAFFNDNIRVQTHFMLRINESLHYLGRALDDVSNSWRRERFAAAAHKAFSKARAVLREAEHGRFETWYPRPGERDLFRFDHIDSRMAQLYNTSAQLPVTNGFNDDLPGHALLWETDFSSDDGWGNITGGRGYIDTGERFLSSDHDGIAGPFATLTHSAILGETLDLDLDDRTVTALYFNGRFDGSSSTDTLWVRLRAANPRGDMPNIAAGVRGNGTLLALGVGSHERLATSGDHVHIARRDVSGVNVSLGPDPVQYRLVMDSSREAGTLTLSFEHFDDDAGEWQQTGAIAIPGYRWLLGDSAHGELDQLSVFFRTPGEIVSDMAITQWAGDAPPGGFGTWRASRFSAEQFLDDAISGPFADPDGDGVVNLLEFALGGDPLVAGVAALPVLVLLENEDGLALQFTRTKAATDVLYEVQSSIDLHVWETIWTSAENPYPSQEDVEIVTVAGQGGTERHFLRLRVSLIV